MVHRLSAASGNQFADRSQGGDRLARADAADVSGRFVIALIAHRNTRALFGWCAVALRANIDRYGIDLRLDIPVHGTVATVSEKLQRTEEQVANAQAFCAELAGNGRYLVGCPVQYSTGRYDMTSDGTVR